MVYDSNDMSMVSSNFIFMVNQSDFSTVVNFVSSDYRHITLRYSGITRRHNRHRQKVRIIVASQVPLIRNRLLPCITLVDGHVHRREHNSLNYCYGDIRLSYVNLVVEHEARYREVVFILVVTFETSN